MLWNAGCESVEDFYSQCVGVPVPLLPTVLGLKLAVDLDLGSSKLPDRMEASEEILCWVKAEPERSLLTIDQSNDVLKALLHLAERCFNLMNVRDNPYGVTESSPLTFLRIIHQIQPLVKGGATAIFNLLESKLPADFSEKYGLSWNLLKASIGSEQEPIVEIKVATKISIEPWYKGTPMPTICIMDQRAFEQSQSQWFFGLPLPVEPICSVIYNSLRYDDSADIVTFHLREKDWNNLKSRSWMWISSRDLIQVIQREPIFLGRDENVKGIERVDPVEKFGLPSVQTFTVAESTKECQILKVLKVEESNFTYCAELEILDSVRCKAQTMKISFQPVRCATNVAIYFAGYEREKCIMYFSCSVDEKSSKFQISRKQKKVLCNISKREDGTVGELVIQRPAPVPFHALPLWDADLHDVGRDCGKMFRTKSDHECKIARKGGSPFFDLRETIAMILWEHVKEPKV